LSRYSVNIEEIVPGPAPELFNQCPGHRRTLPWREEDVAEHRLRAANEAQPSHSEAALNAQRKSADKPSVTPPHMNLECVLAPVVADPRHEPAP
jgi:hypothetical protein